MFKLPVWPSWSARWHPANHGTTCLWTCAHVSCSSYIPTAEGVHISISDTSDPWHTQKQVSHATIIHLTCLLRVTARSPGDIRTFDSLAAQCYTVYHGRTSCRVEEQWPGAPTGVLGGVVSRPAEATVWRSAQYQLPRGDAILQDLHRVSG